MNNVLDPNSQRAAPGAPQGKAQVAQDSLGADGQLLRTVRAPESTNRANGTRYDSVSARARR